jgi:hypothetical protein
MSQFDRHGFAHRRIDRIRLDSTGTMPAGQVNRAVEQEFG